MRVLHRSRWFVSPLLLLFAGLNLAHAQELMKRAWGMSGPYGIEADKAWTLTKKMKGDCSASKVVVAVIDTGIDMEHPALQNSLWTNEKARKGKVDADGIKGDLHGWDFVRKSGQLVDLHNHGSHIAGIISANGKGIDGFRGVCPGVKIMALRYYDAHGSGEQNLAYTVKAIDYAVKHGANIINYSGGGPSFSKPEFDALKRAEQKGILVVAAAGNEHANADQELYFPAAYPLSNIISVASIDAKGALLPSSNWGVQKVHVAAPGNSILSTLPHGAYGFMTGTSQATAFVTGIAALLWSEHPELKIAQIKEVIQDSAIREKQLAGKTQAGAPKDPNEKAKEGGRVSAYAALQLAGKHGGSTIEIRPMAQSKGKSHLPTASVKSAALSTANASKQLPMAYSGGASQTMTSDGALR